MKPTSEYSTLSTYNDVVPGEVYTLPHNKIPAVIVPDYGQAQKVSLSHYGCNKYGTGYNGHYNITCAYPNALDNCTTFRSAPCKGDRNL